MTDVRVRSDEITWQLVDGDVVVLDLASATYLRIGGAGTVLWPMIAEGTDAAQLTARLVEHFGLPESEASGDVDEFLQSLLDQNLIVRTAGSKQ